MAYGFFGRLLEVDLTHRRTGERAVTEEQIRCYFLGSGLAARMLYDTLDPHADPFAPESPLMFLSGLFTGGTLPGTSKLCVCARSPLTGIWNEATVGGHWPAELRKCGWDGVIVTGRADSPVTLFITGDRVELRDASALWGLDTYEVEKALRPQLPAPAKVATIGPAGEQGVLIASIIFDPPISRVAARAGVGAVMGRKNLKAVVVHGEPAHELPIARPDELREQLKLDREEIRKNTPGLTDFGTSGGVVTVEKFGDLPIKNWQLGSWEAGAVKVSGQTMQPRMLAKHYTCHACPVRCGKIYKHEEKGLFGHGPEYETIGMLGANVLNDDPELLVEGNEWCNRYGIDTISTGAAAGFAIEAFEKGLLTARDTGGLTLRWDGATMVSLVHRIGRQQDVGRLLGQGVKRAADALGPAAQEFAVHGKGLEFPAHDPRGHVSMALNYATAVRGACHLEALTYFLDRGIPAPDLGITSATNPHTSDDKPPIVRKMQDYMSVFNPLGMCKFLFLGRVGPSKIATWLNLVCGWNMTADDVMTVGERLFNLKRMYNVRLGMSGKDDRLPPRLLTGGKPDGFARDVLPDLGNMLHRYYRLRGWGPDGIPTAEKLRELWLA